MKPVKHIKTEKKLKVSELVKRMGETGFGARKLSQAAVILEEMWKSDSTIFLGVAGAMVPGGMKNIILDLLDRTDVFVTTGANLTHDLIESLGHSHYQGDETSDDSSLHKQKLDRI